MTTNDPRLAALVEAVQECCESTGCACSLDDCEGDSVEWDTARLTALLADALTPPADAETAGWAWRHSRDCDRASAHEARCVCGLSAYQDALRARAVPPGAVGVAVCQRCGHTQDDHGPSVCAHPPEYHCCRFIVPAPDGGGTGA